MSFDPNILGRDLLAFVCAVRATEIDDRIDSNMPMAASERERAFLGSIQVADSWVGSVPATGHQADDGSRALQMALALSQFGIYDVTLGESPGNAIRREAGGTVETVSFPDDPLGDAVAAIARDWFPATLVPAGRAGAGWFGSSPGSVAVVRHPRFSDVITALNRREEPIRRLFPPENIDEMTSSQLLQLSTGSGGSVQPMGLLSDLLTDAEQRMRQIGQSGQAAYIDQVTRVLGDLRRLASGDTIQVPLAVGLTGAQTPELDITVPWGRLRNTSPWERANAPLRADLTLLTKISCSLRIGGTFDSGSEGPPPGMIEALEDLRLKIDKVRLAVLMSSEDDAPVALGEVWRDFRAPFLAGGSSWPAVAPLRSSPSLPDGTCDALVNWCEKIEKHFTTDLHLAVRRTLSSIADRGDPADGLVDAVIALESLFGTGQNEISLRLSAAVAWLLEPNDHDRRLTMQGQVAKLYSARSKVVHGAAHDPEKIGDQRVEASRVAMRCLRALFVARPELIGDRKHRGIRLLTGG